MDRNWQRAYVQTGQNQFMFRTDCEASRFFIKELKPRRGK